MATTLIAPSDIHAEAVRLLPPQDIDHHASDLYIRVTPASKALIARFQYNKLVKTFRDCIEGDIWYDLPFCYDPTMTRRA